MSIGGGDVHLVSHLRKSKRTDWLTALCLAKSTEQYQLHPRQDKEDMQVSHGSDVDFCRGLGLGCQGLPEGHLQDEATPIHSISKQAMVRVNRDEQKR